MTPNDFRRLVAAGLSTEQIAIVMEMMDRDARAFAEAEEARKAKGRDRVTRWREARNVTETQPKVTVPLTGGAARVEDKSQTTEIEPQKEEKKDAPARDISDFKAEFQDLDAERLAALIKHRRAKHGQISGHSARLFRKAADACGLSISQAVDTCIDRNWITLKPDWLNKPNGRAPPQNAPSMADVFQFVGQRQGDERQPEDFGSDGAVVPYLSVAGQRRQ
jgi:hypothetical protein